MSRRKQADTRVEARNRPAATTSLTSLEDLVQFGTAHRRVVHETGEPVADPALAQSLGCRAASRAAAWPVRQVMQ